MGLHSKGSVTLCQHERKVVSGSNNSHLDNADKSLLFTCFLYPIKKSEKGNFLSLQQRDTETETEGQKKRKIAERWHIGSETGTRKQRLRENQRQGDRGLKIETKSERGAREKTQSQDMFHICSMEATGKLPPKLSANLILIT